jgi:hypothetical protein
MGDAMDREIPWLKGNNLMILLKLFKKTIIKFTALLTVTKS